MSQPSPKDTSTTPANPGVRTYDADSTPASSTPVRGVYDTPSRPALPLGAIIGIVVLVLIVAFVLFQFVF